MIEYLIIKRNVFVLVNLHNGKVHCVCCKEAQGLMAHTTFLQSGAGLQILPPVENAKGTVVICPGGGYEWLSPREGMPIANAFCSCGWSSSILHYTCFQAKKGVPIGTIPLHQLGEAVQVIRSKRPGQPVVVCGFSAGGHLAASLGIHWQTLSLPRPDAMVLCYPVVSAGEYAHRRSFSHLAPEGEQGFFSLEAFVGMHVPPTFIWHTAADETVPVQNSLLLASALAKVHVPFELHVFPQGEHGLSLATSEVAEGGRMPDSHVAQWFSLCIQWLDIQLKE